LAPENTVAAFDHAMALGVDGLELDVRFSRDGVVVVHHDTTLSRTTDLQGPVAEKTADELARANAACQFRASATSSSPWTGGDRVGVPLLADVLQRYRDTRVIIELKQNEPALAETVLAVVRQADADERVCLGSFGRRVLRVARQMAPHVATSAAREEVRWALYRSWVRWPVSSVGYSGYQVPEWAGVTHVVSRRFVRDAHNAGLGVQVWTVDDPDDARRLLEWGVDAIITDRPDLMVDLESQVASLESQVTSSGGPNGPPMDAR
jgi:glycerophosphoryl diester phosphodiesterase